MPASPPRSVLVTGASSGIGQATAELLGRSGWRVFAGVRSQEDAERLGDLTGVVPLRFDVTDPAQRASAVETLASELSAGGNAGLNALVNAAGVVISGPLEVLPIEDLREQFEVNVIGLHALTQACLPHLRRSPAPLGGRIVQLSSISGRVAFPMEGAYNASKFALEGLSDTLRLELRGSGVSVTLIEPGVVRTAIWDRIQTQIEGLLPRLDAQARTLYGARLGAFQAEVRSCSTRGIEPEAVAHRIRGVLDARRAPARVRIGRGAHLWDLAARVLPTTLRDRGIAGRTKSSP